MPKSIARFWTFIPILTCICSIALFSPSLPEVQAETPEPIRVGWIGGMTGPTAKWGSYQSALLGVEAVNQSGGINGRPLEVVFEDAHCNGAAAVSAFRKLAGAQGFSFILGGHCSPESMAFASLAERQKVVTIAAMTSTPKLTDAGDYIFRLTPVSTQLADLTVPYARNELRAEKAALLYELTDYVVPVAERFRDLFKEQGGKVSSEVTFNPGETDFKSMFLRISQSQPDVIYLGAQAPDTALLLVKQIRELNLAQPLIGNEQIGGAFLSSADEERALLEGVIFAEPECDRNSPATKKFTELYTSRYKVRDLPFSCYTGEPYDAIRLLAEQLGRCGEDVTCVKEGLYAVQDFPGASGPISFDKNGDVSKVYELKVVKNGKIAGI